MVKNQEPDKKNVTQQLIDEKNAQSGSFSERISEMNIKVGIILEETSQKGRELKTPSEGLPPQLKVRVSKDTQKAEADTTITENDRIQKEQKKQETVSADHDDSHDESVSSNRVESKDTKLE